ncbi:hypothetical protein FO519_002991 [Halicephalobus sp. NKZ332]|nr:hypothetical protein FO519_002991 [Halicephalobus sp. NKZ332]
MDPACSVCQTAIEYHETLRDEKQSILLQALKVVSSTDAKNHAFNLLDMLCHSESPLQIPLCKDCATRACNDMRRQLSELEGECIKYDEALRDLMTKRTIAAYDADSMKRKLQQLCIEEQELQEELTQLEEQEKKINNDVRELSKTATEINEEGDALYKKLRINHRKLIECSEDSFSLNTQAKYANESLSTLTSINVLDMTFFIWVQDNYGTINGLRLGRLPHEVVEWNEINAAFGQVCLLVQILADRIGVVFTDYELDPRGNSSYVRRLSGTKPTEYPLFGQGGWKPFGQIQLDHAIKDLLMYRMDGDRIIENESPYRIKMQFNSEERWTKAMKLKVMKASGSSELNKGVENTKEPTNGNNEHVVCVTPPLLTGSRSTDESVHSKRKNLRLKTAYFYLLIILGHTFLDYKSATSSEFNKLMMYDTNAIDESLLAGKFPGSPPDRSDFFNSRLRWRNDAELASYAWSNDGRAPDVSQINMLMTENRVSMAGPMSCYNSDGSGSSSSCNVASRDPSLLDYDVIDVSWRYDIENEKNRVQEYPARTQQSNMYDEQYERDLQVLHDKGFMSSLSTEETTRYEELAKAQYADFYHSVARPSKMGGCTLTDISHNYPSSSSSSSRYSMDKVVESSSQPPFDNITLVYTPQEGSSHNQFNVQREPCMNATVTIPEDEYLEYFNSTQVIQDLSASAVEQGRQSFEAVFKQVVDGHISANIEPEFSPFDEPLPFSFDDSFFDGPQVEASATVSQYSSEPKERSTSPSSGFVSGSERSISPNSDEADDYRLGGKLIPQTQNFKDEDDESQDKFQRRRGRQSKDNDLVRKYSLPASAEELAGMSHKALQRLLKDPTLSEAQRSLIKKIRRRGRNKEAARKCRERRVTKVGSPQRFVVYPPNRHD